MKKFTEKLNESVDGNKLPTAEEFFDSSNIGVSFDATYQYCHENVAKKAIEFAKLYVEAALIENGLDKDLILNTLEKIK
jgi:hypothetical protein